MSRVFTRGGIRSGGGGNPGGPNVNNNNAGVGRSRGSASSAGSSQREWKDQENVNDSKDADLRANLSTSNSTFSSNPPPRQSQQPVQSSPQQQQPVQNNSQRQPARPIYNAKPRGSSDKTRGGPSGDFVPFQHQPNQQQQQQHQQHANNNRDNTSGGRQDRQMAPHKQGQSTPRDHNRNNKRDNPNQAPPGGNTSDQQQNSNQRNFEQHSSRETSSIDTTENDENTMHLPRNMIGEEVRENQQQPPHFMKINPSQQPQQQQQGPNRRDHNNKPDAMRGPAADNKRGRDDPVKNNRADQNRAPMNLHQNTFNESFGKAIEEVERENDSLTGFGGFKNGHMGRMLPPSGHVFEEPMNIYSSKQRFFPMGDMGHTDKGMAERGFEQTPHDGGDIFSIDVFWRGPEREEKWDSFMREEPSPPDLGGKSMIWSNQTSGTPIPHSQSESPHFNRPLVSGFGMDHTGFPSNLLAASSPSMMDPQHMDSVAMHQRKMQQHLPINQFLAGSQMPDRIHPSNMNDRMPGMFSQPAAVQQMITPIRMGYHPHPQFSDSFIQAPLNREPPVRIQQQNANQPVNAFTVNPAVAAALNIAAAQPPRSPHVAPQEKNWSWEEQQQPEVSEPPPVKEPVEDFGEFVCPSLRGPKNFDNLCTQAEELREAIQEHLKSLIQSPHKERLRRVMFLCFTLWNVIRDAILLDSVQACDKTRELDQIVWRDGFYPIFDLLRSLGGKPAVKHEAVGADEATKILLSKALKFYNDLIPKVLHPFGGSVTAQTLVIALSAKAPMADHIVISLRLAERLLTHLGDLYRYQADLPGTDGSDLNSAKEAYHKACLLSPFNGQPHSQLALVAKRQNRPLDIAFHAMRAISARLPCSLAASHLNTLWTSVEKTYENKYRSEEKAPMWSEVPVSELTKRVQLTFLVIHASLYHSKFISPAQTTQGSQFLGMLEAVLNQTLPLGFRDVLLQMMAINIYRISVLQADSHGHALLMDLSFNMFDIILARLLKIFEVAPDLDSAVYLEDTAMLSPVVKIFVEWIQSSYQKWFPLSASQLSAPRDTKRTNMWSRLVSLVNLSLTLNVAGVAEERFPDSTAEKLYEDLFLAGMQHVHPTLCIFYRETKLHEAIAEPRFRFRKMQALGPVLLTVSPSVARLQWNRFLPTDAFLDKNVKVLWAPLEPPPVQRVEPLPVLESRAREPIPQPTPVVAPQPERPDTARQWRPAQTPVNDAAEQNWPSLGQATKIITEDRRERTRTASTNSAGTDDGRSGKNGESDKRLRTNDASQLKQIAPEPLDRKPMRQEESSKQYYLIDTNCLIDFLEKIEKKLLENDDLVILIPAAVYRELWKLHERKNYKALAALSFINDAMDHSKGRILVITTKGEVIPTAHLARKEVVIERGSNDDIILRTCITLSERGLFNEDDKDRRPVESGSWRGSLLLLTSDANMRVKARKENICCRLVSDVLA